ncbi:filamin-B-like [Sitophilus oryzae]|uniref:Filamin-B-like n=1 Tax=Sitophilus oryzae TaxID=7048 RepID=A0A6J2YPY3_SITOR|nr:filamin-B-like [Sitophilus oryzae]
MVSSEPHGEHGRVTSYSKGDVGTSWQEETAATATNNRSSSTKRGGAAELAVAVRGPVGELPVKVTGDIHSGFTAEFTPAQVGAHQISVDYNGRPVQGTPFVAKAFDSNKVTVGTVARGTVGRPVTFSVDASEAGEGNLEITISARGLNIPTQVHPQGNARFAVSFVPAEACDHVVNVAFNKRPVS